MTHGSIQTLLKTFYVYSMSDLFVCTIHAIVSLTIENAKKCFLRNLFDFGRAYSNVIKFSVDTRIRIV